MVGQIKKLITLFVLVALLSMIYIKGFDPHASLTLNKKEFSSGETLEITIHNNAPIILFFNEIQFGQLYVIEYFDGSGWKETNWLYPGAWQDILYSLLPGKSFKQSVELFPVKEGMYRVRKEVGSNSATLMLEETFEVVEGTAQEEIPMTRLNEEFWRELEDFCSKNISWSENEIRENLNSMISKAIAESDPKHETFIALSSSFSQTVFMDVKHATKEFIEKWPPECQRVEIDINVVSWALTE